MSDGLSTRHWHIAKVMRPNFIKLSVHAAGGHGSVGPVLMTVQYIMYFLFCGRRHVCTWYGIQTTGRV